MGRRRKQVFSYLLIGIACTLGTWVLWNILFISLSYVFVVQNDILFSTTQWISAIVMIYPSFLLNKTYTFASQSLKSNMMRSTIKVYLVYISAPLLASILTYSIQQFVQVQDTFLITSGYEIPVGLLFLQAFGLLLGVITNFLGQKYWVYQ